MCECVWPLSLRLKSPPGWHLLGLSEGIWSGACCQSGPCITFKEVSASPSPYHSSSTAPPARLVEAPLGISGTLSLICVSSKSIRPFWAMLKGCSGTLLYSSFRLHCFCIFVALKDLWKPGCIQKGKTHDWRGIILTYCPGIVHLLNNPAKHWHFLILVNLLFANFFFGNREMYFFC